jgi:[ribosomal protein S18]-alanine N-acetyltransferase
VGEEEGKVLLRDGLVSVKWYDDADLSALTEVHATCFPDEKWRPADFIRFADKPGQIVRAIVKDDGEVIGSLLYRNSQDEVRIARVAILPEFRRQGVATYVVRTLIGPNSPNRKRYVTARLREHNVAAQLLLRKLKFELTQVQKNFYREVTVRVETEKGAEALVTHQDAYTFRLEKTEQVRKRRAVAEEARPVLWP